MDEFVRLHQDWQKLLAKSVITELAVLWPLLDIDNLRGTTAPWLKAVRPVIERGWLASQYLAAEFYKNSRRQALPDAEPMEVDVPNPYGAFGFPVSAPKDVQMKILVSQRVTGPAWLENHDTGELSSSQRLEILRSGFSKASGAATRQVLNGGRVLVQLAASADPMAAGVQRVVDERSDCASCQSAAREPALKSAGEKRMWAAVAGHDFCRCTARPVFL